MLKIIFELILSAKCLHKISNFEYFCVCYCDRYLFYTHPVFFLDHDDDHDDVSVKVGGRDRTDVSPLMMEKDKNLTSPGRQKPIREFSCHRKRTSKNTCYISPLKQ